ncbi:putative 7 alpha-cephem-methoxylase [Podospora fimiseda]|uniref:7 alpha-cephem-methoxylase n=1 Tax=Podospora fimiseda TaxID=252190 RepID=A0AAN7BE60_9PEZI|nr:putative 7 alpha-cephem-methoxylase [Podospora fimiseda]
MEKETKPYLQVKNEVTRLGYFQWKDIFDLEKPYEIISQAPAGITQSNFSLALGAEETIHDLRGQEKDFNLDTHGFQILRHLLVNNIKSEESWIEQEYLPSVDKLLKETLGDGAETFMFDWRLRSSDPAKSKRKPGAVINLNDPLLCVLPVQAVHVDQSSAGAINRVKHHMGERAKNLWRPILYPVENYPLAVCDGRTAYIGESLYPLECPDYRCYYLNRQTKDKVLAFKTYDSAEWVPANCCPHTSFQQSEVPAGAKYRESIEVRALAFTEK